MLYGIYVIENVILSHLLIKHDTKRNVLPCDGFLRITYLLCIYTARYVFTIGNDYKDEYGIPKINCEFTNKITYSHKAKFC